MPTQIKTKNQFLSKSTLIYTWIEPPPLSDFLLLSSFPTGNSTQTGLDMINSPRSMHLCSSPNYDSSPILTFTKDVMLHECRENSSHLCERSMRSTPKKVFPAKSLSYFRSKRSM